MDRSRVSMYVFGVIILAAVVLGIVQKVQKKRALEFAQIPDIHVEVADADYQPATSIPLTREQAPSFFMKITSPDFEHNGSIPVRFTCDGEHLYPTLNFHDFPEGTVSLALIVHDPDVPTSLRPDGNWDHWLLWDMPPLVSEIYALGAGVSGTEGYNTSGKIGYTPPCPPDGEHRYFFTLYALDTTLGLDPDMVRSKDFLLGAMQGHILEQAELVGRYERA